MGGWHRSWSWGKEECVMWIKSVFGWLGQKRKERVRWSESRLLDLYGELCSNGVKVKAAKLLYQKDRVLNERGRERERGVMLERVLYICLLFILFYFSISNYFIKLKRQWVLFWKRWWYILRFFLKKCLSRICKNCSSNGVKVFIINIYLY